MKDTEQLRELLFAEIDNLKNGKSDNKKAKIISDIATQIIYTTRLEVENKRLELDLSKQNEEVKKWMDKDFSSIQKIKV